MPNGMTIQREQPIRTAAEDYPIIALGEPSKEYPLPGERKVISRTRLEDYGNVILLGERSGGVRDCLGWWCQALQAQELPWAFIHSAQWKRSLVQSSPELSDRIFEILEEVGARDKSSEKANALIELNTEAGEENFYLLIRDFAAMGKAHGSALTDALRIIRDLGRCPNLHFVIGCDSESYFADDLFSGMLTMAHRLRLAPFSREEITKLFSHKLSTQVQEPVLDEAAREILKVTGGQPALCQDLLGRLQSSSPGNIDTRAVREAFRRQRKSPPGVTRLWQQDLRSLLKERIELVEPMRKFVSGQKLGPSRLPPPSSERPLMIGGWLRLDEDGRWGISSEMHADLARDVLDRL